MYDNPLSGRIANSIVQLMVISGNYRWLLGLRPRPHQGGCSSPLDPRLLHGSMLRIDMAWPPGRYRFQSPLLRSSSGSKGCCGTGFRTLIFALSWSQSILYEYIESIRRQVCVLSSLVAPKRELATMSHALSPLSKGCALDSQDHSS